MLGLAQQVSCHPVSYTHLDVYKRQILMHTGKDVAESAKIPQNLQEEMDSGKDIFLIDVYKRQVVYGYLHQGGAG